MKKFLLKILFFISFCCLTYQIDFPDYSPFSFRTIYFNFLNNNSSEVLDSDEDDDSDWITNKFGTKVFYPQNNIGYASHRNFYADSVSTNDFAIVGDSFVNSRVVGINNSISYILDSIIGLKVYNFGIGGGNLKDYYDIYEKYDLKKLEVVFIILTGTEDLRSQYDKVFKISKSKFINKTYSIFKHSFNNTPSIKVINYPNVVYLLHNGITKKDIPYVDKVIKLEIDPDNRFPDGHYKFEGNNQIVSQILKNIN